MAKRGACLWRLGQPTSLKLGIGMFILMLLMPLAGAVSVPGYESRHLVGLRQLVLADEDIIVSEQQFVAYAWSSGKIQIDMRFIATPNGCREEYVGTTGCYKFKSVMNHELSHIYCREWGHSSYCFRTRDYYLSRWYDVPTGGQNE